MKRHANIFESINNKGETEEPTLITQKKKKNPG